MRDLSLWVSLAVLGACATVRPTTQAEPGHAEGLPDTLEAAVVTHDSTSPNLPAVDAIMLRLWDVDRTARAQDMARWIRWGAEDPWHRLVQVWVQVLEPGQFSDPRVGAAYRFAPEQLQSPDARTRRMAPSSPAVAYHASR